MQSDLYFTLSYKSHKLRTSNSYTPKSEVTLRFKSHCFATGNFSTDELTLPSTLRSVTQDVYHFTKKTPCCPTCYPFLYKRHQRAIHQRSIIIQEDLWSSFPPSRTKVYVKFSLNRYFTFSHTEDINACSDVIYETSWTWKSTTHVVLYSNFLYSAFPLLKTLHILRFFILKTTTRDVLCLTFLYTKYINALSYIFILSFGTIFCILHFHI